MSPRWIFRGGFYPEVDFYRGGFFEVEFGWVGSSGCSDFGPGGAGPYRGLRMGLMGWMRPIELRTVLVAGDPGTPALALVRPYRVDELRDIKVATVPKAWGGLGGEGSDAEAGDLDG